MPKIKLGKKLQQTLMTAEQIQPLIEKYQAKLQHCIDENLEDGRKLYKSEVGLFEYMLKYAPTTPISERTTTELKKRQRSLDVMPIVLGYFFASEEDKLIEAELTKRGKGLVFPKSLLKPGQTVEDAVKEMTEEEERDRKKVVVFK